MINGAEATRSFKLPEFKCLLKLNANPLMEDPLVDMWIEDVRQASQLNDIDFGKISRARSYIAYLFPEVSNMTKLEVVVKFFLIYFLFDDINENNYVGTDYQVMWDQVNKVLDVIEGKREKLSKDNDLLPCVHMFYELMTKIIAISGEDTKWRLIKFYRDYSRGNLEEAEKIHISKGFVSLEQLLRIKWDAMGLMSYIQYIEYAYDVYLTDLEWNDFDFQLVLELAAYHTIYANDIGAFEKEYNEQRGLLRKIPNTAAQIKLKNKCSIEEALNTIAGILAAVETKFISSIRSLVSNPDKSRSQKKFVHYLEFLISANYYCSVNIGRYSQ